MREKIGPRGSLSLEEAKQEAPRPVSRTCAAARKEQRARRFASSVKVTAAPLSLVYIPRTHFPSTLQYSASRTPISITLARHSLLLSCLPSCRAFVSFFMNAPGETLASVFHLAAARASLPPRLFARVLGEFNMDACVIWGCCRCIFPCE